MASIVINPFTGQFDIVGISGGGGGGVSTLNGLSGALTVVAGSGITVTPSGSNITIAATSFDPTIGVHLFEDFLAGWYSPTTGQIEGDGPAWNSIQLGAPTFVVNSGSIVPTTAANPGILQISVAATGTDGGGITTGIYTGNTFPAFVLGGGIITFETLIKIPVISDGTNNTQLNIGFRDSPGWAAATSGWNIQYQRESSLNWQLLVTAASTQTTLDSGIPVTTGWHHIKLVSNAAGTSIAGFIDGVSMGTAITTNIPSVALPPMITLRKTLGAAAMYLGIDYIKIDKTLSVAR
jgi:hypothetical protein